MIAALLRTSDLVRADNEAIRRRSNIVKRKASNECQRALARWNKKRLIAGQRLPFNAFAKPENAG